MEFLLRPLSQTFSKLIADERYRQFPLYVFILATEADGDIFPDLLRYYGQLHQLTGPHMLVFAPGVDTNEVPGEDLSVENTALLLRQYAEYEPAYNQKKTQFLERQRKDSYELAALCGIPYDTLPCILFFDSLNNPQAFVKLEIKTADAPTIVKDFETIVERIKTARADQRTDLLNQIEILQGELLIKSMVRKSISLAGNFLTAVITALAIKGAGG